MTKERRLAIEMWEQIVEALENEHNPLVVIDVKEKFLHGHNLRWKSGCSEGKETLWKQVVDDGIVYAARRILELLKGGQKNDGYSSDASAL